MKSIAFLLVALAVQANAQHAYQQPFVSPVTVTVTVTENHTIRDTTTSDVWVTRVHATTVFVPQYSVDRIYTPAQPDTVPVVVTVTGTDVSLLRETSCINPVHTVVSVHTNFQTVTDTREFYNTFTHLAVYHQVSTVPVQSTQTLVQRVVTSTLHLVTVTITSTTRGYY